MQRTLAYLVPLLCILIISGLAWSSQTQQPPQRAGVAAAPDAPAGGQAIVLHITSGPDDLFAIMTALHMAADARTLGRKVIIMFSKAGVRVPMENTGWELRMGDEPPVRDLLIDLQRRGVDLIICDFSAHTLGIYDREFLDGTFIANTNETLLKRMGSNAAVFTF